MHIGSDDKKQVARLLSFFLSNEKLVQHTTPVIVDNCVLTDPREFIQMGIWRSLFRVAIIQARHELNLPVTSEHPFFAETR